MILKKEHLFLYNWRWHGWKDILKRENKYPTKKKGETVGVEKKKEKPKKENVKERKKKRKLKKKLENKKHRINEWKE